MESRQPVPNSDPRERVRAASRPLSAWTIIDAPDHLARRKRDPWAAYWKTRQPLSHAMNKLGFVPKA
jgi:hypothetical protein